MTLWLWLLLVWLGAAWIWWNIAREDWWEEGTMARPIGPRTVAKAIAIIEDSQLSHRNAIAEPGNQAFGSPTFHRQCIRDYEQVLRLLRRVLEQVSDG